jgi:hypothetical protein
MMMMMIAMYEGRIVCDEASENAFRCSGGHCEMLENKPKTDSGKFEFFYLHRGKEPPSPEFGTVLESSGCGIEPCYFSLISPTPITGPTNIFWKI